MKKMLVFGVIGIFIFTALSCSSSAKADKAFAEMFPELVTGMPASAKPDSAQPAAVQAEPVRPAVVQAPPPPPRNPYYDGDGGTGKSLAILIPTGTGLSRDQAAYLPTLVQGVLVGDMAKYSSIKVLDRMNLEKVLKETESGIYQNEDDFVKLGEIANVGYAMTGNISRTSTGYALQVQVTDTKSGITSVSYSGACTVAELDNFTGIKKASLELLAGMEIRLTDLAKQELSNPSTTQFVDAQTALSRGIVAERSGSIVDSLVNYYAAIDNEPSLSEALSRLNTLAATVRSGNIGESVRNDIARRRQWLDLFAQARAYFDSQKDKIIMAELVYDPIPRQGAVDYQRETVELIFSATLYPIQIPSSYFKMMQDLNTGLDNTRRNQDWKIDKFDIPLEKYGNPFDDTFFFSRIFLASFVLVNENNRVIGRFEDLVTHPVLNTAIYRYFNEAIGVSAVRKETTFGGNNTFAYERNIERWHVYLGDDLNVHRYDNSSGTRQINFIVRASDITDTVQLRVESIYEYLIQQRFAIDRTSQYPLLVKNVWGGFSGQGGGNGVSGILYRYGTNIIPVMTTAEYRARGAR